MVKRYTWCDHARNIALEVAIHRPLSRTFTDTAGRILPYRGPILDKSRKMFRLIKTSAEGGDAGEYVHNFTEENCKDKIPVAFT